MAAIWSRPWAHKFSGLAAAHSVDQAREMARFSLRNVERAQDLVARLPPHVREASEMRPVTRVGCVMDEGQWEHHKASVDMFERELPERKGRHRLISEKEAEEVRLYCTMLQRDDMQRQGQLTGHSPDYVSNTAHSRDVCNGIIDPRNRPHVPLDHSPWLHQGQACRLLHECVHGPPPAPAPWDDPPVQGPNDGAEPWGPDFPDWGAERSWAVISPADLDPATGHFHKGLYYVQQNAKTRDLFIGVENQTIDESLSSDDGFNSSISHQDLLTLPARLFSKAADGRRPNLKAEWSGV